MPGGVVSTMEGRHRLQRDLAEEVDRRGLSWSALGESLGDGVSVATIRSYVQQGVAERPQRRTLAAIDRFMGWAPGSARAVLDGGEPVTDNRVAAGHHAGGDRRSERPALSGEQWDRLTPDQQRAVLNVIESMLEDR